VKQEDIKNQVSLKKGTRNTDNANASVLNMFVHYNDHGGVDAPTEKDLKRAKEVDLITLPKKIRGTNCFNCRFIRNKMLRHGKCSHPKVDQDVNERMCCVLWSAPGEYRQFQGRSDKYK
jgi:hypothetical protein